MPELTHILLAIGEVTFIDLILSGDNSLVIGATVARIPRRQRMPVLILGGMGAILFRILCTLFATFLIEVPYLQAIGGFLLFIIALRLLPETENKDQKGAHSPEETQEERPGIVQKITTYIAQRRKATSVQAQRSELIPAIITVMVADISMSIDNVIAIGAMAHGEPIVLIFGLALSILLLLFGSALLAEILRKLPTLIIVASLILCWIAANLVWNDLQDRMPDIAGNQIDYITLIVVGYAGVILTLFFQRYTRRQKRPALEQKAYLSQEGTNYRSRKGATNTGPNKRA